jgi:non-specific serine/threonine protein kinase
VGTGGVGKTRLALALAGDVANAFSEGVVWVDLAPLADAALVPDTVARALDVTPTADQPIAAALARHLRAWQTLLLLDNCEHLLEPTALLVTDLLRVCPALQVLTTSRAPLHLRGEVVLPVDPLPTPDPGTLSPRDIADNAAVRLFAERIRAVRPGFALNETSSATVAALCRRLDGLPLAIELAAARGKILSPDALLARMSDRLHVLECGPRDLPPRQQTIRETIAWSYGLLRPETRRLFRMLAVFTGGWTVEAAAAVAGADDQTVLTELEALVDQSLIRLMASDGEPRFAMLETIRAFGLEQPAESPEQSAIRDAHAAWCVEFAETANRYLEGPEQRVWLHRLDTEIDNLRAALTWLLQQRSTESALRLAIALADNYWHDRSGFREGQTALEHALALDDPPGHLAVGALWRAGVLAHHAGDYDTAQRFAERALPLARECRDIEGEACSHFLVHLIARRRNDFAEAVAHVEAAIALFRRAEHWRGLANMINAHAVVLSSLGDFDRAESLYEEARELFAAKSDFAGVEMISGNLADLARRRGHMERALQLYQRTLRHFWDVRTPDGVAEMVAGIAAIATERGENQFAACLLGGTDAYCERSGVAPYGLFRDARDACVDLLQARLDEAAFMRAVEIGRQQPIEQIVSLALAFDFAGSPVPLPTDSGVHSSPASRTVRLTRREREVLALLCQHLTNPEIAGRLFVGTRTIDSHVANIMSKLDVANRRDAAAAAARLGLV